MQNGLGEMELELEGLGEYKGELEDEFENEFEFEAVGEFENESELEAEFEDEFESEFEAEGPNPVNKIYPDAMMENLGRAAMNAESEDEAAEHFLPLIPLVASKLLPLAAKALPKIAAKVLPRVAQAITRVTPGLTRGVSHLTRALHRNPQTRQLVRVMPSVARRAVATIARRTAAGHPISPRQAVGILKRENHRLLRNPALVRSVLHRSKIMDHKMHRLGAVRARPHGHVHRGMGTWLTYPGSRAPTRVGYGASRYGGVHVCPTCGTRRVSGVRRTCCCC